LEEKAASQEIEDTDFGLTSEEKNSKFLEKLRSKPSIKQVGKAKLVKKGVEVPLYNSGADGDNGYYWAEYEDKLLWLVKYRIIKKPWLPEEANHRSVSQVALWRDDGILLPSSFTSKMFFGFVLRRHKAVLSDKEQTEAGKRFWLRRLSEAAERNYKVALVNFNTQQVVRITSPDDLEEKVKEAWGTHKRYQAFRWLIWK
jgi:hypothetical protein